MLGVFVWLHRWLGIALCLLFAAWFISGAILLFVPFPSLPAAEARARAATLVIGRAALPPASALAHQPDATGLRLVDRAGRPAYLAATRHGDIAISALDGAKLPPLRAADAAAIASRFAATPVRSVTGPFRYDQWVAHQAFDPTRPLYRVRLADSAATDLYVSAVTGEVVQKTTGYARAWNWAGAVVHWLYFTPLRRAFAAWDQTVWWLSLAALTMTALGIGLGVYRTSRAVGSARPALSPFKGWLRWHHLLGVFGGAVVLTWILSGWLSMDHGRLFPRAGASGALTSAYENASLAAAASQVGMDRLQMLHDVSSVTFTVVGGRLVATGEGAGPAQVLVAGVPADSRAPKGLIRAALQAGFPDGKISGPSLVRADDFYARAEGVAPGADLYRVSGRGTAKVFVDPATGALLAQVSTARAVYDWVYYALHTFNFPGLATRPGLRATVVLVLLAAGFSLIITSAVVGVRRLRILAESG